MDFLEVCKNGNTISELVSKLLAIPDEEEVIEITETARSFDGSVPPEFDIMISFSAEKDI